MSCYHPLQAFRGKSEDASKIKIVFKKANSWRGQEISLPCGQCVGCRLERSRQWAVRCMHEAQMWEKNCFLTLTYNDENLPYNNSLQKSDFQDFMKRLRKKNGPGIRYYHCGEYGERFQRPHYHALLFNYDFPDKKLHIENKEKSLYTSDELQKLWTKGHALIGEVTFESAAYVARYILKKVTGKKAEQHYDGRIPEYTTMSRRPGIGKTWIEKYQTDVYPLDRVIVRGHPTRPPRYYDALFNVKNPSDMALIKIEREKNSQYYVEDTLSDGRIVKVSDSSPQRLAVKEEVKMAQIKNLKRSLEGL